jgi:hypothetical protein
MSHVPRSTSPFRAVNARGGGMTALDHTERLAEEQARVGDLYRAARMTSLGRPPKTQAGMPGRPVYSDRGECWPSIDHAAAGLKTWHNAIQRALDQPEYTCRGRKLTSRPPVTPEEEAASAARLASFRVSGGRFGKVRLGVDVTAERAAEGRALRRAGADAAAEKQREVLT